MDKHNNIGGYLIYNIGPEIRTQKFMYSIYFIKFQNK